MRYSIEGVPLSTTLSSVAYSKNLFHEWLMGYLLLSVNSVIRLSYSSQLSLILSLSLSLSLSPSTFFFLFLLLRPTPQSPPLSPPLFLPPFTAAATLSSGDFPSLPPSPSSSSFWPLSL
uniref:Uncharacterized protein n=1 Tax=Nelumbo nucifera TaxID=4432 RepID=A0A822YZ54_NELNU|nr:TPA_asm: hypothetical protein HUJ06_007146 [Nelumbo nucifera]